MKIAICDDDQNDLDQLLKLLRLYETTNQKHISIEIFMSGEAFLQNFRPGCYDAVFLDIYMRQMDGVEVARTIRRTDENVRLIFTTISSDYLSDGFAVEASHYLVKPLTEEKINEAMRRIRNIYTEHEASLILPNGNSQINLPQSHILYIETIRNGIDIHCDETCFSVRSALSAAMEQLDPHRFLQCHRYFIVNLGKVDKMEADAFLMSDGKRILIRRDGRREIREAYHNYVMKRLRGELS